jgi:restriction endonuclease S subunit
VSELPDGWKIATIAEVTDYISRGKSPKYTDLSSLPVVNQKAIRWFGIQKEHLKYVHPDQFDSWAPERYIQEGDILWNSTGTGTIGRACLVSQENLEPPKVVDSHVTIVRPNKASIESSYLFAWIRSSDVQDTIASLYSGSTNQVELNRAIIAATQIPLAPLNEQKRIADKLNALLARVDACRERLDCMPLILKRFRQAVLAAATSGQLTEDWRSSANEFEARSDQLQCVDVIPLEYESDDTPETWYWAKLGDLVINHDNRRVPVKATDRAKRHGPYPYYGAFGIIDKIDEFLYDGDFLLIAEDGKNLESRQRPIALLANGKFWVNNHAHVLQQKDGMQLAYLNLYLNSPSLDLTLFLTGIDQVKLTRSAMDRIPVSVPSIEEQQEISAVSKPYSPSPTDSKPVTKWPVPKLSS